MLLIKDLKVIKEVLVSTRGNLKKQAEKWRDNWQVTVPTYYTLMIKTYRRERFEPQENNKTQVNPRNLAHHILA